MLHVVMLCPSTTYFFLSESKARVKMHLHKLKRKMCVGCVFSFTHCFIVCCKKKPANSGLNQCV